MSDETKIAPALTADEWAFLQDAARERGVSLAEYLDAGQAYPHKSIALANAALPDDDPRKITRDTLHCLHEVLANFRAFAAVQGSFGAGLIVQYAPDVERLEEVLASYLPPETDRPLTVHDGGLAALPPDLERELRNKL